ncbi:DUF1272 domain-containing protein [Rhodococcus marinonascens]|uniref:DUF1272 domain-containing protein n=1 Tax=Rhodococcus marinonascens TaxID=38311 RepID=UPI0009333E91|nr:DUF1272 domain-containing protein [Rhodococcus marinonascens]
MLTMKTKCEACRSSLRNDSAATICSYVCTFCSACAAEMDNQCPNCGGELCARPRRTTGAVQISRRAPARILRSLRTRR